MNTKPIQRFVEKVLLAIIRKLPDAWVGHGLFVLGSNPSLTDRWGYHIRPIHYYEPLPDFQSLRRSQFETERDYPGIEFNVPEQITLINRLGDLYQGEINEIASQSGKASFDFNNAYFSGPDACLYYALIRDLKPARVIEIGSGFSTQIASRAMSENIEAGHAGEITCIEPYPQARLSDAGLDIQLLQTQVEALETDPFKHLVRNDILFIDSSHVAKCGGDVCKEFHEILPRLNPGVWVHVHDIFFPQDYPYEWVIERRLAFNEQYLLETFLSFNHEFTVRAVNYLLCLKHQEVIRNLCPAEVMASQHLVGSSFWMQRT